MVPTARTQRHNRFEDPKLDDDDAQVAPERHQKALMISTSKPMARFSNCPQLEGSPCHRAQDSRRGLRPDGEDRAPKPPSTPSAKTIKLFATKSPSRLLSRGNRRLLFLPFGQGYVLDKTAAYDTDCRTSSVEKTRSRQRANTRSSRWIKETGLAVIVFKTPDPKEMNRVLRKWLDDGEEDRSPRAEGTA